MPRIIVLLLVLLLGGRLKAQTVVDRKGTKRTADTTADSWKNDNANTMVKLAYNSNGSTVRPDSIGFVIKDNGRVGIGTATPLWMLDAQGTTAIGQFKRIITGTVDQAPGMLFTRSRGSVGAETNINSGDFLGKIQFRGRIGGTDTDYGSLAYIATGTTAGQGHFAFTKSDLTTEVMSIDNNTGQVGIGFTSPSATLDVNGTARIATVNNMGNDTAYKTLVWNTVTKMVQTTDDNSSTKKTVATVASGASANIGSAFTAGGVGLFAGAAYEIRIMIGDGCGYTSFCKFIVTGTPTSASWRIGFVAGISPIGPSSATNSGGTSLTVLNPYSNCAAGGNSTAFNYTLSITNAQLSITNNGNVDRTYIVLIEKVIE